MESTKSSGQIWSRMAAQIVACVVEGLGQEMEDSQTLKDIGSQLFSPERVRDHLLAKSHTPYLR